MKGINNQKCIGPCLSGNKNVLHPIYLFNVTNDTPFCPTFEWFDNDNLQYIDKCTKETDKKKIDNKDIELLYALPNFGFDCADFIKKYYDLHSFESALEWIYSENNTIATKLRVMNCAWKLFSTNNSISDQLIDFYIEVINKIWVHELYNSIYNFINVEHRNIFLKKNKDNKKIHKIEKINYILEKFNNRSMIYNILKSFIDNNKSNWDNIENFNNTLKKYYIEYVFNKIKSTLDKK
ncbi:hypothetical protein Indivirus_3_62 [Indivirus ILV1]|uniref:Uncharacterized protein n=1 Tax=Indivirus ILV1 TaxID=1977633 RepID=A0A1V0SDL4_9VIRU|nr:hypothetical protein Indivirus_3_62 [Indivirus ILV1]